jgi:hypothetical protein
VIVSAEGEDPQYMMDVQCLLLPEVVMEMRSEGPDDGHPLVSRDPWEPPPPEWDT